MVGELKKVVERVSTDHLQEPGRQYNIFLTQLVLDFIVYACIHVSCFFVTTFVYS